MGEAAGRETPDETAQSIQPAALIGYGGAVFGGLFLARLVTRIETRIVNPPKPLLHTYCMLYVLALMYLQHPYCIDSDILLFLFFLTNVPIESRFG